MRRRGSGRIDEVAFADVAMATLGPIVLLMLVFMGIAAKTLAETPCERPEPEQVAALGETLKQWTEDLRGEVDGRRRIIAQRCERIPAPAVPVRGASGVPEPLANVCEPRRKEVFAAAGLDPEEVAGLMAARDLVSAEMALCLGQTQAPPCWRPRSAEVASLRDQLAAFSQKIRRDDLRLRDAARERCGTTPPAASAASMLILPTGFAGMCAVDMDSLMATAGLDRETLMRQIASRDAAIETLHQCVGMLSSGACRTLRENEVAATATALKGWLDDTLARNGEDDQRIKRECPTTIAPREAEVTFLPAVLGGICAPDVARVLAAASVDSATLRHAEGARRARLEVLRACTPPESSTARLPALEFQECSANPVMPSATGGKSKVTVPEYFDGLAAKVAAELGRAHYNRIDIFGHTDDRELKDTCRRYLNDRHGVADASNPLLSSLRAHRVRDELIAALNRRRDYAPIVKRIDDRDLRIYAIGVGAAEPDPTGQGRSGEDRQRHNRRMELRFVRDTIGQRSP